MALFFFTSIRIHTAIHVDTGVLVNIGEYGAWQPLTGACVAALEVDAGVLAGAMPVVEDAFVDVFTAVRGHGEPTLTFA